VTGSDPFKAVVLLSGGLDSAVALAVARSRGRECRAISFDYGQRHRFELDAARRVAASLGAVEHLVVPLDLRLFGGSALTADIDVPKDRALALAGPDDAHTRAVGAPREAARNADIPITYVPARNLIFLSIATAYAEVVAAGEIHLGVNAVDYSGYPDCRPEFIRAFERAANLGTRAGVTEIAPTRRSSDAAEDMIDDPRGGSNAIRIVTPLIDMPKAEIIRTGSRLGVDFSLTHSCYDPDPSGSACGRCDSCRIRAEGFRAADVPDPTRYARR
jgi:7-cyano-7-deazaguanine synthase